MCECLECIEGGYNPDHKLGGPLGELISAAKRINVINDNICLCSDVSVLGYNALNMSICEGAYDNLSTTVFNNTNPSFNSLVVQEMENKFKYELA